MKNRGGLERGRVTAAGDPCARPIWRRYGAAVACVVLGCLARETLTPTVGTARLPFVFFYPAIAWAAWYGGLGPAVLATALSVLAADFYFFAPRYAFAMDDPLPMVAYVAASALIVAAIESMHRARRGLVREVAERKRAEAELATSRDLLATTLASIGDGVIVTDVESRVTFLNAEAERLTGWTALEACGRPTRDIFAIVNEETRLPVESPVDKVLRLRNVVALANHTVLIARGGSETPIDDSAAPVQRPGEPLVGVVLVFRDVT
jgi:PAS domain S-box-containing protein